MGRFIEIQNSEFRIQNSSNLTIKQLNNDAQHANDKEMVKKMGKLVKKVTKDLDNYNFNYAAEGLYEFTWHEFADKYIEDVKNRIDKNSYLILNHLYLILLKLLHPFIPFVTEEIYQRLGGEGSIMVAKWPNEE